MKPQPNLVLVLTDHFRPDTLGQHTPNLMQLAAEGVRFTNAYCSSPLCQPSRNGLITGLPTFLHGVCGNQNDPIRDELRDDTFMHRLRCAGYRTALIGKHHYIDRYAIGLDVVAEDQQAVEAYGFDHVLQVLDDGENGHNEDTYTRYLQESGRLATFRDAFPKGGCKHPFEADETADGFIGRRGVEFVQTVDTDAPFYLNLSFVGPHPPYWHPGELEIDPADVPAPVGADDTPALRTRRARYLQKCKLIDGYVGRLVEALKARGLYDRTVLLFTSDHGDNLGDHGIWDKRHFYEQSVGVPFILRGPGVPCGERRTGPRLSRMLVSQLDLYPTILSFAGAETPRDRRRPGRDILAMLNDEAPRHRAVFAELATCAMIRTAAWKLVFDPEQGGVRTLFHLATDPDETENLAGRPEYDGVAKDLVEQLLAYRIRLTQETQIKEEQRLQSVRAG